MATTAAPKPFTNRSDVDAIDDVIAVVEAYGNWDACVEDEKKLPLVHIDVAVAAVFVACVLA